MSQSNLLKLDRVQNEAMRVILETTKTTPYEAMRYLLDLPSMEAKHKMEQVQFHRAQASRGLGKRVEFMPYYKTLLPENLGTHCHEWPAGKANVEVQMLVEAKSKPHDIVIYMDSSVTRDWSVWGFMVKHGGKTDFSEKTQTEMVRVCHMIIWIGQD